MSWIKLDDQLHAHPKLKRAWKAHRGALGLHLMALSYCGAYLTDGMVDAGFVEEKLPAARERSAIVGALVDAGMWAEADGGWLIYDFLEYNPSKAQVLDRRRKDSERKRNGIQTESERNPDGVRTDASRARPRAPGRDGKEPSETVSDSPARALFAYWQEQCGHEQAKFTRDRRAKVEARLAEGYTPDQIRKAIDGAARAAFVDDKGKRHDDLELVCRTGSKLEDFIGRADHVVPLHKKRFAAERDPRRFEGAF